MNNLIGLDPITTLLQTLASWLEQRHPAHHASTLDSLPSYLLSDIGLSYFHEHAEAAPKAEVRETPLRH